MPRLIANPPASYKHTCILTIRASDLNYGNHLGNDRVLAFAQEARLRFLAQFGWSELNVEGHGLIQAGAIVDYLGQGFYGEEVIVDTVCDSFGKSSFTIHNRMTTASGRAIAQVQCRMVLFNYDIQKPVPVPTDVVLRLSGPSQQP